jgi:hypothetical protein
MLEDQAMAERDELAHLRDEENRDEFAIRRGERRLAAEEQELERELKAFGEVEEETKRRIEAEWRTEHQGHEPERPPSWQADDG